MNIEIQAIDVHVHDRGLNQEYKGSPLTESQAALSGGIVAYFAMPNTDPPLIDEQSLGEKLLEADSSVETFYGAYLAGIDGNQEKVAKAASRAIGLKLYMNNTTGGLLIDNPSELAKHFYLWNSNKPICVHAEGRTLAKALELSRVYSKKLHVCHVSTKEEILMIKTAKEAGINVTCEVTPHHLFLTEEDIKYIGPLGFVKPALAAKADQDALWENLDIIDCIASDHAPHLIEEKMSGVPHYGLPGLETTLPLMLQAVNEGRLTMDKLVEMVTINPKKIFGVTNVSERGTFAVIDIDQPYYIDPRFLKTKCGWTPFEGHKMLGKVREVYVAGELVFKNGEALPRLNKKSLIIPNLKKNDRS